MLGGAGLFPRDAESVIKEVLREREDNSTAILEIGSGSGGW